MFRVGFMAANHRLKRKRAHVSRIAIADDPSSFSILHVCLGTIAGDVSRESAAIETKAKDVRIASPYLVASIHKHCSSVAGCPKSAKMTKSV